MLLIKIQLKIKIKKMKTNFLNFVLLIFVGATMLTSCETDDPNNPTTDAPKVTLEAENGYISSASTIELDSVISVKLTATKGGAELNDLTIYEDGVKIELDRVTIDSSALSANAKLLFGDDIHGFTYDIRISSHIDIGTKTYSFEVTDKDNELGKATVDITTFGTPLELEYQGSEIRTVSPGTLISAKIIATKGSRNLATVGVYLEGELMTTVGDLSYNNEPFQNNPNDIPTDDKEGFTSDIQLRVPSETGIYSYGIIVTDELGFEKEINFQVSVGSPVVLLEGVLFNSSGPAGYGGLDLDAGIGTGSGDEIAEIRDLGGAPDWKKQIAGAGYNLSTLQYIIPAENGLDENFTFSSINFKEDIANIKANGTIFTESNELVMGDMILVSNVDKDENQRDFLIYVREVNEVSGDNTDNYVFDVKY